MNGLTGPVDTDGANLPDFDHERQDVAGHRLEVLHREVCFEGFLRLERYRLRHGLFAGGWSDPLVRELVERGRSVAVLPYDPVRDEVVLIEQFRIGALEAPGGPWLIEIVAGMLDAGESPAAVARRESLEEAGCRLGRLIPVCDYLVSPGGTSERIALYCGEADAALVGGVHGIAEEGEDIRALAVGLDEALAMVDSGRINSASPIIALQWLALNRERVRAAWSGTEGGAR